MESSFSLFCFMDHAEGVYLKILCLMQDYKDFLLNFLLKVLEFCILHLYLWSIIYRISLLIAKKNTANILIRIVLNLQINLGVIGILMLNVLIHEHGISFHLFGLLIFFHQGSVVFNIQVYT